MTGLAPPPPGVEDVFDVCTFHSIDVGKALYANLHAFEERNLNVGTVPYMGLQVEQKQLDSRRDVILKSCRLNLREMYSSKVV